MRRKTVFWAAFWTLIIYGLIYLCIFVAPTLATPPSPTNVTNTQTIRELYVIAQRFWHADPKCSTTQVFVEQPPDSNDSAWTYENGCTIWLSPHTYESLTPSGENYELAIACTTFLHEYGHDLGAEHSPDPRQVMYPYDNKRYVPEICTDWASNQVNIYITAQEQKEATQYARHQHTGQDPQATHARRSHARRHRSRARHRHAQGAGAHAQARDIPVRTPHRRTAGRQ